MGERPAESIGKKWNDAYVSSLDDAQDAYLDKVNAAGEDLVKRAVDGTMATAYAAAVANDNYAVNVRAAFNEQNAGAAYVQRTDQIKSTGTTLFQQQKMVDMTKVRRGIRAVIGAVIITIGAENNGIAFKYDYSPALKKTVTNKAAMAIADKLNLPVTANAVFEAIKNAYTANKSKAPWLDFKDD